ncbi:MAG: hypothetical protein JWM33_2174 [Caulobacteraceae bacterium]|nr:hypothetical protein [Caulobacteraceae bacterium]
MKGEGILKEARDAFELAAQRKWPIPMSRTPDLIAL